MATAYSFFLACIAAVCVVGVLHTRYHDNLGQRIGMGIACIGAVAEIFANHFGSPRMNAATVLAAGVALFALATVWKKWRQSKGWHQRATDRRFNASRLS